MNYDYPLSNFSKSLLAGVFAGFFTTLINLVYNYLYREATQFFPSEIINVSSVIFATMILFTVAGIFYFVFSQFVKRGNIVYMVVFTMLTAVCVYNGLGIVRSSDAVVTEHFRGLYIGMVAISGLVTVFAIPYLVKHHSIYA